VTKRLIAAALALFPVIAYASLDGLWTARRDFGPDVHGPLRLTRDRAEIAGRIAPVKIAKDVVTFELPNGEGRFRGVMRGDRIAGHWVQPPGIATGGAPFATPVTLTKTAAGWSGVVQPLDDHMTLVLPIKGDSAFLHNPERNVGRFLDVQHIVVDGSHVKLLGGKDNSVRAEGTYDAGNDVLSIYIGDRGGTYDFHRTAAATPGPYVYREPERRDDGWQVGTLNEAGISTDAIASLIDKINATPVDSVHASDVHALLIARHGKLVLEEYFHGTNPDEPHDTRSAAKSLTSVLVGAAKVPESTPVYAAMGVATDDPRKQAMTLANLLTQSSGLDCDDNDDNSPGNENTMQEQTAQPDWWKYTLDLKNIRPPGEKSVYCSCQPNLAGGVLSRKTGRWLPDLFRDLVAEPMQMRSYGLFLMPAGDAYMGGGVRLTTRDFLKLAQLVMDGGRWHGKQIVGEEFAKRSTSQLTTIGSGKYGYLWWIADYPYRGRTVRAFFADGNGGQVAMGIPELDLVIAFNAGNYNDRAALIPRQVYVPEYILPAVK
jgi:CubicO group peptidase (beta-lactamase class C family)